MISQAMPTKTSFETTIVLQRFGTPGPGTYGGMDGYGHGGESRGDLDGAM